MIQRTALSVTASRPSKLDSKRVNPAIQMAGRRSRISRRALIERVLGEKHRLNNQPKGERVLYTGLELIIMTVKQLAASGHQQATKLFTGLMEKYGRQDPINQEIGYLVVPERLTTEEWEAKYGPKDEPPEEEPFS